MSRTMKTVTLAEAPKKHHTADTSADLKHVTPLDFDHFMPWMCAEWGVDARVAVVRLVQEKYVGSENRDSDVTSIKKHLSKRQVSTPRDHKEAMGTVMDEMMKDELSKSLTTQNFLDTFHVNEGVLTIQAYYDSKDKLVEITFVACPFAIPRKVIRAISLCLPFHTELTRMNIRKGGLTADVIYEISKLLPHSNITEICLDGTNVEEANYDILLQEVSPLKYLSLKNCNIDDNACSKIAMNLVFGKAAANSFRVLELPLNNISDKGAKALAQMLRSNRCLLHLNLAGNKISDDGARKLISSLMEFPMTENEILDTKRRRYIYLKKKQAIKDAYLENLLLNKESEPYITPLLNISASKSTSIKRSSPSRHSPTNRVRKESRPTQTLDPKELAEHMANVIVGDIIDLHHPEIRDGCYYSRGNFVLCSLNLASNDLHFSTLKRITELLSYQHSTTRESSATGLMRVVIDGNNLPQMCEEFNLITMYLNFNIFQNIDDKRRRSSTLTKRSRSFKSVRSIR